MSTRLSGYDGKIVFSILYGRHAYRPEKIGTVLKFAIKLKVFCRSVLSFPVPNFKDHYNLSRQKASMPSVNSFFYTLKEIMIKKLM